MAVRESGWNKAQPAAKNPWFSAKQPASASFTLGAEASNTRRVTVQLKDARGNNLAQRTLVKVWLSDAATGVGLTATVPTSNLAIGTAGTIINSVTTNKCVEILSDATGAFNFDVIQTAAVTYYVVVLLPDGTLQVSTALAFA